MATNRASVSQADLTAAIERKYGAEFRANQVPILDEENNFTGEFYDRRLGGPPDQPDPNRISAAVQDYFRQTGRQGLKVGAPIPDFDPIEQFESEGLFDSFGNILASAGEQSLTGLALEATGVDLFDRERLAHFEPNLAEQLASGILSFGFPLDLAALIAGGGVGGITAKGAGFARAAGRFGVKALPGTAARVGTRALTSAGGFGTYEGARGIFEGEPIKRAAIGAAIGGAVGAAGAIVPRSIKIPKVVTTDAGARAVGRAAEVSAEVFTLGALPGPLEGRAPTVDDFSNAAGFILGMKLVGKVASIGKRRFNRQKLPIEEEIKSRVAEGEELQKVVLDMGDRIMRETPEQFSAEFYGKIRAGKPGEKVGTLEDLFVGREIKKSFKGELDTPIYIGGAEDVPKRALPKKQVATGWLAPDPAGKQSIWLNQEFPGAFAPTLIHEALHLKRQKVSRPLVTKEGGEIKTVEAAAERGAARILETRGQIPLREAVAKRAARPQWVKNAEKRGIVIQKRKVKPRGQTAREAFHISTVSGKTFSDQIAKVRSLIGIANEQGAPLYLTRKLARTALGKQLGAAGLTKDFKFGVKVIGTGRGVPRKITVRAPITEAEVKAGQAELDAEFKAITTKPTPAEIRKAPPLRTVLESEARSVRRVTSDNKIIRAIKAGIESLPKTRLFTRAEHLGKTAPFKKIVSLAKGAAAHRHRNNQRLMDEFAALPKGEGQISNRMTEAEGKQWTEDLLARKLPRAEVILKKIRDAYNAELEKNQPPIGLIAPYFPRVLQESIGRRMELGLLEIAKIAGENPSDAAVRQAMEQLTLRKFGFKFKKGEVGPEGKPVAVSAIETLLKNKKVKSVSDALEKLGIEYVGDVFVEPRFTKKRSLDLPSTWFETDARKVIPIYVDTMAKSIGEKAFFGGRGQKFLALLREIESIDITERDMAKEMMSRWTGLYQRQKALSAPVRTLVDAFVMTEVGTKIGLGQATGLNLTQWTISFMPRLGVWPTIVGGLRLLDPSVRTRIRATGVADNFAAQALQAAIGDMPGGWFGKFANFTTKWSGFSTVNKFNLYWAASAFERAATQWQRQAQGTGRLAKLRRRQMERLGLDWRKRLTGDALDEAMFNFAKDSQLQAGVLSEPLFFNDPAWRPLVLFKRFGFKQAALIKDIITKDVFWGDPKKLEINPMPIIRLAVGGSFGGAGIGWALDWIKGGLGGQPIIERGDSNLQRWIENIATVGAFGMVGDALAIEKMSNLPRTLKFITFPVALADAETLMKNFTIFYADMERYDDFWLAGRRNAYRVFDLAGTFPRHFAKRLRTPGQVSRSLATQKGQQKTVFFRLMLDGRVDAAIDRVNRWNRAHPDNILTGRETSMNAMRKWMEARARSIAEGQAVKGTPEFRKIKREEQQKLRKRFKENR